MLHLQHDRHRFSLTAPSVYFDVERLQEAVGQLNTNDVAQGYVSATAPSDVTITIETFSVTATSVVRRLFGQFNSYPCFEPVDARSFQSKDPVLSCIIVLTENDLFVRHHLIPSIVRCTPSVATEIIVIYNGASADLSLFPDVPVVRATEYGCVAKAYNTGVTAARGRYVALFHDDCMLDDTRWAECCLAMLEEGYGAVTPEVCELNRGLRVAKGVPLVLALKTYEAVGGHDEFFYIGIEDIDFTYQLLSAGWRIGKVDIDSVHGNGMSTILVGSRFASVFRQLFSLHVLSRQKINALARLQLQNLRKESLPRALQNREHRYLLEKHGAYLRATGRASLAQEVEQYRRLEQLWATHAPFMQSILEDRARLVDYHWARYQSRQSVGRKLT